MSREPLMPEVMDGLTAAVRRDRPRRRWFLPRVLGAGLVVLAVGGTAVAAVAPEVPWNPFGGDPNPPVTLEPPPADQTGTLAVLRRPQTDADRSPLVTAYLKRYRQANVRLGYIRYLREVEVGPMIISGNRRYGDVRRASLFLIPQDTRRVKGMPKGFAPEEFCLAAIYDSWPEGAAPPPFPPPHKDRTGKLVVEPRPAELVDRVTGGGACGSSHVVRMKGIASGLWGQVNGIVPDGVATVRATTRDGQIVTGRVVNNAYELLAPGRDLPQDGSDTGRGAAMRPPKSGQLKSGTYEWLDASGQVIRRMPY